MLVSFSLFCRGDQILHKELSKLSPVVNLNSNNLRDWVEVGINIEYVNFHINELYYFKCSTSHFNCAWVPCSRNCFTFSEE